ncbi:hypothetical protein N7471_005943 [Penicillium samsonianum]|uniref:uncharacterized protein n=1 Tax=Penicillium samsonianum TaxID=1882272 RepID=UPI002547DAC2|nr:uncharacterized protein N7471_005943 [Penicillium samsonianum]KAJ6139457.1 hypothetical protein N7471_005943 [Penicillium samsonianum]
MFAARRSAPSTRQLLRTQRRWGSHAAHEPVNEGFGRSFYITSGSIAAAFLLYRISESNTESGKPSWIAGLIDKWTPSQEVFEQRNAIHTAMMEKAASDRHLLGSQGPAEGFALRQPDMLNAGSPYNVSPGSQADLSHVVAHYQRKNQETEESRVARMKDGKVVSLYD